MTTPTDFRVGTFALSRVSASGIYLGQHYYHKLYFIENAFRVLIHSVLTVQYSPENWWQVVTTDKQREAVDSLRKRYRNAPTTSFPGNHGIYYLYLSDLNKILRQEAGQFQPLMPNVDDWVIWLEQINLPRNIVGHMNWLNASDKMKIDETYQQAKVLLRKFKDSGRIPILTPQ
jgi:hypothetical protein